MKIAVIMGYSSPWSWSIAQQFSCLGHEVFVFGISGKHEKREFNLHHIHGQTDILWAADVLCCGASHGLFGFLKTWFYLRRFIEKNKPQVVISLSGGRLGLLACLSGIRPHVSYVTGSDVIFARGIKKMIEVWVLSRAKLVFANGSYLATMTQILAPRTQPHPLIIGVDIKTLQMSDFSRRPIQMICSRSFGKIYNNESIIRALSMLPSSTPTFRMIFTSAGEHLSDAIRLADEILREKMRERVVFMGGVDRTTLFAELSQSQIYLSMSRSDGISISLLEAMGSGLFPILSDIPQNREMLDPHVSHALLVPVDKDQVLADAIHHCLTHIDFCQRFSEYNRNAIEKKANIKKNMETMLQLVAGSLNQDKQNNYSVESPL